MNKLKLKICGMGTSENILEMSRLDPDYLGFIFFEKSPRNFSGEIPQLPENIQKTGVFVNASIDFILEKIKKYQFKAIQLHGDESVEFCTELKEKLDSKSLHPELIKVFSVKEDFNFNSLKEYEGIVDYFLFDTGGKNRGGNGIPFNWELLHEYPLKTPFILSGGIGLEEAEKIKEFQQVLAENNKSHLFYGIDVNSRFEVRPGIKNFSKLKEFKDILQ